MESFRQQVMNKKELAAYVGKSTRTVDRGFGACLQPFRFAGEVVYNKAQVERHFAAVLKNAGRCDGSCNVIADQSGRSFRRGKLHAIK